MTDVIDQKNPVEVSGNSDSELKERFETIKKELLEVGGPEKSDDLVEIEKWALDGKFAEYLLKNESCLTTLKTYVKTIKRDGLSKKAWKSLKELDKFLDDIGDSERMKKDYDEFMEKIQNPKKLNTMKSWEIRRLNIYLWAHENDALAAYKAMKPIYGKSYENKMKSEDRRFFDEIWNTLKDHYSDSDKFFEADYGKISETPTDLYSLAWNLWIKQWDGRNLSESDVVIWESSIISKKFAMDKFNKANETRINSVKTWIISAIDWVKDQLAVKWWKIVLKSSWEEITVDSLLSMLQSKWALSNLPVVENELSTDHLKNVFVEILNGEEIKNSLENLDQQQNDNNGGDNDNHENDGHNENDEHNNESQATTYEAPKASFRVKLSGLKDKIKELWFYDGNEEGENIKFDMAKVKEYLEWLKDKPWKELEVNTTPIDRWTWTIAVQIALNYLSSKDGNSSFNVELIDGIRGNRTQAWVRAFQEKFWLRKDWLPGKDTITKLLEELKFDSTDGGDWKNEWDKDKDNEWEEEWKKDREATLDDNKTAIKDKIDKFDANNPILDLSALSSLSEDEADQILKWIKDKLNGQTLQKPVFLKLNWLSTLDNKVAEILSIFEWWIAIDKILNNINFDSCESEITMLKTLAPDTNEKIKIIAPTQELCDKLKEKGITKVEVAASA